MCSVRNALDFTGDPGDPNGRFGQGGFGLGFGLPYTTWTHPAKLTFGSCDATFGVASPPPSPSPPIVTSNSRNASCLTLFKRPWNMSSPTAPPLTREYTQQSPCPCVHRDGSRVIDTFQLMMRDGRRRRFAAASSPSVKASNRHHLKASLASSAERPSGVVIRSNVVCLSVDVCYALPLNLTSARALALSLIFERAMSCLRLDRSAV